MKFKKLKEMEGTAKTLTGQVRKNKNKTLSKVSSQKKNKKQQTRRAAKSQQLEKQKQKNVLEKVNSFFLGSPGPVYPPEKAKRPGISI